MKGSGFFLVLGVLLLFLSIAEQITGGTSLQAIQSSVLGLGFFVVGECISIKELIESKSSPSKGRAGEDLK